MNKSEIPFHTNIYAIFSNLFNVFNRNKKLYIPLIVSIIIILISTYINMSEYAFFSQLSLDDFKVDMAPTKDVIATENVSYIDEDSTFRKKNEKRHSIGAVFYKDTKEDARLKKKYEQFCTDLRNIMDSVNDDVEFVKKISQKYPYNKFEDAILFLLHKSDNFYDVINISLSIFSDLLKRGIINIEKDVIEEYASKDATIIYRLENKVESVSFSSLISLNHSEMLNNSDVSSYIKVRLEDKPYDYDKIIQSFIQSFIKANVIYDKYATEEKVKKELEKVPSVIITILKGEKIIEKNIVIKEEDYKRLEQYIKHKTKRNSIDGTLFLGFIIYILAVYALAFFLFSKEVFGEKIESKYLLLLLLMCTLLYLEVLFLSRVSFLSTTFGMLPFLPCVLFSMLLYVLKSKKMGIYASLLFALSCLSASNFNMPLSLFSLFSSIGALSVIRNTGRRIDLIKTASILAFLQPLIVVTCLILFPNATGGAWFLIFASSLNGFFSGVLLLGFLPLLEVVLNCPTTFRLIEISDLNSPLMKQMLVTVSGTYSHSMMVATLAENACRAIGADALLARVGAYYHDIGKMQMGEYFIENQHDGLNKHDGLPPRLSATVLRAHVQRSIEKAKSLGLPESVIDIVAEHHGNGLIAYFYNKAKENVEREENLNKNYEAFCIDVKNIMDNVHDECEFIKRLKQKYPCNKRVNIDPVDFSYPGNKPKTRESAVVMLSDITEAGCRSLQKHSVPALTKFINAIFKSKIESGQLDDCKLTFSDITIIKNTFIDILSGYYHSRIKYPNQKDDDDIKKDSNNVNEKNEISNGSEK